MENIVLQQSIVQHSRMLYDSFRRYHDVNLIDGEFRSDEDLASALYHAEFVLVSHDTQDDPVFNYANEVAQILWEMTWDEFVGLPSKFSAEPVSMEERRRSLDKARQAGVIRHYDAVRISRSGRRFWIRDASLWNVYDNDNSYCGQAA